jgi:hypothetical protein
LAKEGNLTEGDDYNPLTKDSNNKDAAIATNNDKEHAKGNDNNS